MKTSAWRLIAAVILTFAAGFVLKFFELNTYLIIIGFRFHIGTVLPFLFIAGMPLLPYIKKEFVAPRFNKMFLFLLIVLVPMLIGNGILYLMKYIDLGDPEYFYEFGLSSIFDYPIYLVWNAPQLIMLYFFLLSAAETFRVKFIPLVLIILLLFGYEFIPMNKAIVSYTAIGAFGGMALITALLVRYYKNVYWFTAVVFTLLWSAVLLAGSSSKVIINNLFASQFRFWEGILDITKPAGDFYIDGFILAALVISAAGIFLSGNKEKSV